jgi:hypothetical protein
MNSTLMPTKPGQICKIFSGITDMESQEVYIVTEDPSELEEEDEILVVNLKDLQRNIKNPADAERIPVRKEELVVVGDDLATYVQSWNIR